MRSVLIKNYLHFIVLIDLRPLILLHIPKEYIEMMQKYWDADPSKRPTIRELRDFALDYLNNLYKNKDLNSEHTIPATSNLIQKSHSSAYHLSRILDDDIIYE
jgi:hypothetical protein